MERNGLTLSNAKDCCNNEFVTMNVTHTRLSTILVEQSHERKNLTRSGLIAE